MCRYPARSAALTACWVSAGAALKTPSPTAGIELPSFRVTKGAAMTQSLPGAPGLQRGAKRPPQRWAGLVQGAVTNVGVKVIPWIPAPAKRALFRGRSVIIDGNTLDPTLQLMLSGMRLTGSDGLSVGDDVAASRAQMHDMLVGLPGPQIHVGVNNIS